MGGEEWEPSGASAAHDYNAAKERFSGRIRSIHNTPIGQKY
jgi:hypothetical protein